MKSPAAMAGMDASSAEYHSTGIIVNNAFITSMTNEEIGLQSIAYFNVCRWILSTGGSLLNEAPGKHHECGIKIHTQGMTHTCPVKILQLVSFLRLENFFHGLTLHF